MPRIDPKVNLVAVSRDLYQAELRLSEKKIEASGRRKYLADEWKKLELEQEKFKKTFYDFDRMIEENAIKTRRAMTKKKEQVLFRAKTEDEINRLEVGYAHLAKVKEQMEVQVKEHGIYENYLWTVVKSKPDEFRNPHDVFNKFGTLDEARTALAEQLNASVIQTENVKDKLERQIIEQNTTLTGLNNKVAALQIRYRIAKEHSQKWDDIVHGIQEQLRNKYEELLSVKRICWSIYNNMCKHRRVQASLAHNDFEQQLLYIKKFLVTLKNTINYAQNTLETGVNSVVVEKPKSPLVHKYK